MECRAGHRMDTGKRGSSAVPGLILGAGDWRKLGGHVVTWWLIRLGVWLSTAPAWVTARNRCPHRPAAWLELHLAGGEGLVLHGHQDAAAQHPDAQRMVLLVRLLVPPVHHRRVEGGDQRDLGDRRQVTLRSFLR